MGMKECGCPEARAWRAYWTADAIAERLTHELALYRGIIRDAVWWGGSTSPVPPRKPGMNTVPLPTDYVELERKRAEPCPWPPRKR
jgi:hypothetical protein